MNRDYSQLRNGLSSMGLGLSELQEKRLNLFFEMLIEKNKVMNLTAITDFEEVCVKHFLDSAALLQQDLPLDLSFDDARLIDLGSGAGFPGLVLKILNPSLDILLLDALQKRVDFLNEVILAVFCTENETAPVRGISAMHGRAEEIAGSSYAKKHQGEVFRSEYQLVTARAVSKLDVLAEYALPLLKQGGFFCAYKSADIDEEVSESQSAIHILGGEVRAVHKYILPGSDLKRSLVFIQKITETPDRFPRPFKTISKKPLT